VSGRAAPARARLWLALILLAGAALILPRLGSQSLWVDEGITVLPVLEAHDVVDLVRRVHNRDSQPPASHLVLYALRDFLPRTDFGWRLPSFFLVEAGIALLFGAVARRWGPQAGLLAAACSQVSPFLAFYAMEARNYALWLFAAAAGLYAIVRWAAALADMERVGPGGASGVARRRALAFWTVVWGAANALGLWTHLFHLFAIATQVTLVVGLILASPRTAAAKRRALFSVALAQALTFVLFSPWFVVMVRYSRIVPGVGWTRPPTLASLLYYPYALVFGFSLGPDLRDLHLYPLRRLILDHALPVAAASLALVVLALALVALARAARRDPRQRGTLRLFVLAPIIGLIGPFLYVALASFPLLPRHMMFVWPVVPILQALAFLRLPRLRPALAAVVALQALALANLLWNPAYAKDDERGAVRWAETQSGAGAVILGDVAPAYTTLARGLVRNLTDPGDPAIFAGATDVWFVDNRPWEDPEGRYRAKIERATSSAGLRPAGEDTRFRGLVLRHWRRESVP
jgi:4-amino-4-deoxy-L-arabinose transferase-like glycosyltransferase